MKENQVYVYGHELDEREIRRQYPYSMKKISKHILMSSFNTITFDVLMAYSYRIQGYSIVSWGGLYKGENVFIFRKQRIRSCSLPF